ncbi:MAG TPA: hypothetical protein VHU17_04280 [Acidimicrobiales bacterium]|nr:hypothetical protein [Acidimicrobiales bacterium]
MSPESKTHRIAVLQQDNGELQEDVVERSTVEQPAANDGAGDPDGRDEPDTDDDDADEPRSDRVVHSTTVEDVAERSQPAQPVPGTLPRSDG